MKALCVLYGGGLQNEAFETLAPNGSKPGAESSFSLALAAGRAFPAVQELVLLGIEGMEYPALSQDYRLFLRPSWTRQSLLEVLSELSQGFDFTYFAWADAPLLDPALAGTLAERHQRYGAEYSYADGWPYGLAPELLGPGTAGILAKLSEGDDSPVERDALFEAIKKDINNFDIETEISPVDLRPYRLSLTADSRRNLLLLRRLKEAGFVSASDMEKLISEKPELLRTLPAFFTIQVSGACPQTCSICPYPVYGAKDGPVTDRKDFMPPDAFDKLLNKIEDFAGDAVISLSLWGELALHPKRLELIKLVLARPNLSLVIETSGIGWKEEELSDLALSAAASRKNKTSTGAPPPLSWIVSLDAHDPERYKQVRGGGFSEARSCAKTLLSLFPKDTYVQAVRVKDFEDDIEQFYRFWKDEGLTAGRKDAAHIIIQKYDDFAGVLPKLQASDISPLKRRPCWHIKRDMNILLDGRVSRCREDLDVLKGEGEILGNAFNEDLPVIWERGEALYKEHCKAEYSGICSRCDEYYTYNF